MTAIYNPDGNSKGEVEIINRGTDWSAGDNITVYSANPDGHKAALHDGTAAAPVTAAAPTLKVSQTQGVVEGLTGDGAPQMGAIYGSSSGTAASKVQGVGIMGSAKNIGTEGEPDACGVYGVGRILAGGKGRAFGAFLCGRRDGTEQRATGAEIYVENLGGEDVYDLTNGAETTKGLWVHSGTAQVAVGVQIGSVSEAIPGFDVALGINQFAAKSAGYRDNSAAERSVQIKGTHSKAAISVAAAAGQVVIGAEEASSATPLLFEVNPGETTSDPLASFGSGKNINMSVVLTKTGNGQIKAFMANGNNQFVTGSVSGDGGFNWTPGKTFHLGAAGKTSFLRISETGLGFFGSAAVARSAAYTQTYATAARSHVEAELPTTIGATLITELDAELVKTNKCVNELKKLINSVIDDGQTYGLLQ